MFSFDVEVYPFNGTGKTRAFASVVIEGVMEVKGFKVIEGSKGLFVGIPQREGKAKDGERQFYPDVIFREERAEGEFNGPVATEVFEAIIAKYNEVTNQSKREGSARAHGDKPVSTGKRPNAGSPTLPW